MLKFEFLEECTAKLSKQFLLLSMLISHDEIAYHVTKQLQEGIPPAFIAYNKVHLLVRNFRFHSFNICPMGS